MLSTMARPSEALLALGVTPSISTLLDSRPAEAAALASLGLGMNVPGLGWITMHPDDLLLYADKLIARHTPDRPAINWSWRALPTVNRGRHCTVCGQPWLCEYYRWAEQIKRAQFVGWAM